MRSEWCALRLGDVCTKIGSGATPRGGRDVYLESGPFTLIRSQNVHNDGFHHDGLAYITDEQATNLDNVEVIPEDVLLNITGDSVARACQADVNVLPARVNQHVAIIRPNPKQLDPTFLRYFLVAPSVQSLLLSWAASGGTRNALTKAMVESLEVFAPSDMSEQRSIAQILRSLDVKVELNRRMNGTLEEIARALFKSWFVDFDPVRAKMEGRQPLGMSHKMAAQFPDSLVDSELGPIPRDWHCDAIGNLVRMSRQSLDPREFPERLFEHFSIPAYDEGRRPSLESGSEIRSSKLRVHPGSILISRLNPRIKRIWLPNPLNWVDAICSTEFAVAQPRLGVPRSWLYSLFETTEFQSTLEALATGTSGSHQRVRPEALEAIRVVVPDVSLLNIFSGLTDPIMDRVLQNQRESATLTQLRDTLLPRLISGEIRVEEAS